MQVRDFFVEHFANANSVGQYAGKNYDNFKIFGIKTRVAPAMEPSEVIWANLSYEYRNVASRQCKRNWTVYVIYLINIVVLTLLFDYKHEFGTLWRPKVDSESIQDQFRVDGSHEINHKLL